MLARYTGYNVTWVTDQGYTVVPLSCEWYIDGVGMDLRGKKKKLKKKNIYESLYGTERVNYMQI